MWRSSSRARNCGGRISFYHAKHGALSLGATPFHESVGQGLKNLRQMTFPPPAMGGKIIGWNKPISAEGRSHGHLPCREGRPGAVATAFERARTASDAIRRVMNVTFSLSRGALAQVFAGIKAGQRPDPYFVQLYWLLLSFSRHAQT